MAKKALFKWNAVVSDRQYTVLSWWLSTQFSHKEGIIADGSIRSGKTVTMGFSFVVWAMTTFDGMDFAMCGKTIGSLKRNVLNTLQKQIEQRGYTWSFKRNENLVVISKGEKKNSFYLFGGRDESSQDLIQGITLAGVFFDEVALMPESFVNQATARCSVDGSKWWFNCNPSGPMHWFKVNWIDKCKEKNLLYVHFTMDDNPSLSENIRARYAAQYVGVFFKRFILGLWAMAEGIVYDNFDPEKHILKEIPETEGEYYVSSDYGIQNATVFLLWRRIKGTNAWVCLKEWYYSGRDNLKQKTVSQLTDGLQDLLKDIRPHQVIIDPSAAALILEVKRRGYKTYPADNDVSDGIADVGTMLSQERLFFTEECKNTIKEFGLYSWDSKAADRGEDKPIKTNDHAMDAVRYFVRSKRLVKRSNLGREEHSAYSMFM